jgi:hypothetical protein
MLDTICVCSVQNTIRFQFYYSLFSNVRSIQNILCGVYRIFYTILLFTFYQDQKRVTDLEKNKYSETHILRENKTPDRQNNIIRTHHTVHCTLYTDY